ncbi:MAG: cytochrome P460 family protein [Flavobacteriales bacterium]|nr:cytochrome P460 family protein [Flavobacteriales bacterium]
MKKNVAYLLMLGLCGSFVLNSCTKEEDPEEFIADNSTFDDFLNWSLDATAQGADPALAAMAHGGNDSTVVRNVYFKDGQDPVNGEYPVGTVIVKHSSNPSATVNEYTAMVKRGNGFNPGNGDWEWFMLMGEGQIAMDNGMEMRGANLMNGMCGGCHAGAANQDYVFSK